HAAGFFSWTARRCTISQSCLCRSRRATASPDVLFLSCYVPVIWPSASDQSLVNKGQSERQPVFLLLFTGKQAPTADSAPYLFLSVRPRESGDPDLGNGLDSRLRGNERMKRRVTSAETPRYKAPPCPAAAARAAARRRTWRASQARSH